jgi:SAM-dependent methyltransferase
MNFVTADPATLAFYAAEAPVYVRSRPDEVDRYLPSFLARLPYGCSILELGCGGGIDAAYMIEQGFDVDPTDGVPAMAAQAEIRLGKPVRVMSFDELDAKNRYDAVIANASLLHVPRDGLPDILSRIWDALKPGGWHYASYKTGGTEGFDEFGRYYNHPSVAKAEALYCTAGDWSVFEVAESFEQGHFSKPSDWLCITARKA